MALINISLTFNFDINSSVQVGDTIYYYLANAGSGGFDNADLNNTILLGPIIMITSDNGLSIITVQYDNTITSAPPVGSFISFVKDKKINTSNLKGYYADVKLINNSTKKAELFSLGAEISESSK